MNSGAGDHAETILVHGDPRLRRVCRPVEPGEDLGDLPGRLLSGMREHDGIGLAAPQLGDDRRVVAVSDPTREGRPQEILINPEITGLFGPEVPFEEGCLSFPDLFFNLYRSAGIVVRYLDETGTVHEQSHDGVLSRVIQHEIDHLDGVLFIDHLPRWRRWLLAGSLRRIRREAGKEQA